MNTKAVLLKIPLLPLLLPVFSAVGQDVKWPAHVYGRLRSYPPAQQGYIVPESRDTVKGFIRLADITTGDYLILDAATRTFRRFYYSDIVAIRIYSNAPDGPYTDYFNINYKSSLWSLWERGNEVAIYENSQATAPGSRLVLVTPYRKIKMLHFMSWLLHNDDGLDAPLIRFIHKRYKTTISIAHFNSTKEICTYIVEKENEKIKSGQAK
jgi:hypothetical protein